MINDYIEKLRLCISEMQICREIIKHNDRVDEWCGHLIGIYITMRMDDFTKIAGKSIPKSNGIRAYFDDMLNQYNQGFRSVRDKIGSHFQFVQPEKGEDNDDMFRRIAIYTSFNFKEVVALVDNAATLFEMICDGEGAPKSYVTIVSHDLNLIMLTKKGNIKRIELDNFSNIRRNGIIAIGLDDGDSLNWVKLATAKDEIIIGTSCGMAIRFPIQDLRPLGRSARGVNSMKLRTGDTLIGCDIVPRDKDADLLVITTDGFGKRTKISEFRPQNRGGMGLICTKFKNAQSRLTALTIINETDEIMLVTANGVVSRQKAGNISRQGRPATGVKVQNLVDGDSIITVNKIIDTDEQDVSTPTGEMSAELQTENIIEDTGLQIEQQSLLNNEFVQDFADKLIEEESETSDDELE